MKERNQWKIENDKAKAKKDELPIEKIWNLLTRERNLLKYKLGWKR